MGFQVLGPMRSNESSSSNRKERQKTTKHLANNIHQQFDGHTKVQPKETVAKQKRIDECTKTSGNQTAILARKKRIREVSKNNHTISH